MDQERLRRALHAAVDAFLDELGQEAPQPPTKTPLKKRRAAATRRPVLPLTQPSETDRAAARKVLKKWGVKIKEPTNEPE